MQYILHCVPKKEDTKHAVVTLLKLINFQNFSLTYSAVNL